MKTKIVFVVVLVVMMLVAVAPVQAADGNACWGQATKMFAHLEDMGEHSSEQANPRMGLRNLARYLYGLGVLPDDSMQALGAFVAGELGYDIEACY